MTSRQKAPSRGDRHGIGVALGVYKGANGYKPPNVGVPKGTYLKVVCRQCSAPVGQRCVGGKTHRLRIRDGIALLLQEREAAAAAPAPEPIGEVCPVCGSAVGTRGPLKSVNEHGAVYYKSHTPKGGRPSKNNFACPGSRMEVGE